MTPTGNTSSSQTLASAPFAEKVTISDKVHFLRQSRAYGSDSIEVIAHETHMSWVFLVGEKAYKLKKPVRFPYLDFSTLEKREAVCWAELKLNRRLAPDVYIDVKPLSLSSRGLAIGGEGVIVDWLVEMQRLDRQFMLDELIIRRRLTVEKLNHLSRILVAFYRKAPSLRPQSAEYLSDWRERLSENRSVLFDSRFPLPLGTLRRIDLAQRRFLAENEAAFIARIKAGRIVNGHGDLRPEHIWLGTPLAIIDCLEFNARLRVVDPFDEIAYLSVECERLGAAWVGRRLENYLAHQLHDGPADNLFSFYRCYRATLKARLSLAHLFEEQPRTSEKWLPLARAYLQIAKREAILLERSLKRPANRPKNGHRATAELFLRKGPHRTGHQSFPAPDRLPNETAEYYR